jgi:hypothetical protein
MKTMNKVLSFAALATLPLAGGIAGAAAINANNDVNVVATETTNFLDNYSDQAATVSFTQTFETNQVGFEPTYIDVDFTLKT